MTQHWHNYPDATTVYPPKVRDLTCVVLPGTVVRLQDKSLIIRTSVKGKGRGAWVCLWAPNSRFIGCAFSEYGLRIDKIVKKLIVNTDL